MKTFAVLLAFIGISAINVNAQNSDTISTTKGNIIIHFLGHGSLMFDFNGKFIYIDPFSKVADYSTQPKAGLILVTHHHGDHLDSTALKDVWKDNTVLYWTQECEKQSKFKPKSNVVNNNEHVQYDDISIEAVPAYNIVNVRQNGTPYHIKGEGNGYILNMGNKRVYVAGDTENIPEMTTFQPIDIAFLPMNLPYTMTPEMVKEAALMLNPKILYPYHTGKTDTSTIVNLLKDFPIEVRIRKME
ncbi:MAG: MBL fold metallo-hydrolase [Bacteroidales bacterium]|nr:MBL fold metallo-hydrolase [Bacteroidales bacterium]